jgi:hypothetical protein
LPEEIAIVTLKELATQLLALDLAEKAAAIQLLTQNLADGFTCISSDMLALKPPVVCVIGKVP